MTGMKRKWTDEDTPVFKTTTEMMSQEHGDMDLELGESSYGEEDDSLADELERDPASKHHNRGYWSKVEVSTVKLTE